MHQEFRATRDVSVVPSLSPKEVGSGHVGPAVSSQDTAVGGGGPDGKAVLLRGEHGTARRNGSACGDVKSQSVNDAK